MDTYSAVLHIALDGMSKTAMRSVGLATSATHSTRTLTPKRGKKDLANQLTIAYIANMRRLSNSQTSN